MSDEKMVEVPRERFAPWLIEPMRRSRSIYMKVAMAAVLINIFALLTSIFTMVVYDKVLPNNATSSLIALSIGLAIVVIFDFALKTLRAYFVDVAGATAVRNGRRSWEIALRDGGTLSVRTALDSDELPGGWTALDDAVAFLSRTR